MAIETSIILTRLDFISDYLNKLKRYDKVKLKDYLKDFDQKIISERLLELIIQAALDINDHILSQGFNFQAKTNKESFLKMGELGIITNDLSMKLSESAGMRNILAHQYLKIDYVIVFESIEKALKQYPLYILQIQQYLDSLEQNNG